MNPVDPFVKAQAVLPLAAGTSQREVAKQAGVHPSTVAGWLRDPQYRAEVDGIRALVEKKPMDGLEVLAAMEGVVGRMRGGGG